MILFALITISLSFGTTLKTWDNFPPSRQLPCWLTVSHNLATNSSGSDR